MAALLAIALAACGSNEQARESAPRAARLSGCAMTVNVFTVPTPGARRLVPKRYRLSSELRTGKTAVDFWVLDCEHVRVDGGVPGPATVNLVSAVVSDPLVARPRQRVAPAAYDHYVLWADVDRPALAAALRRAGLPAVFVPGLRRGGVDPQMTEAPDRYRLAMPISTVLDKPHDHGNSWWRDDASGRTARLELRVRQANDHLCSESDCLATVTAPLGSALADLLGVTKLRARASFDHLPLDAQMTFSAPRCTRFARERTLRCGAKSSVRSE